MASLKDMQDLPLLKILYAGPPGSGKATNLRYIHFHTAPHLKSDLKTEYLNHAQLVSFEFVILDYSIIRYQLITITGDHAESTVRDLIATGIDGMIFVADSAIERMPANMAAAVVFGDIKEKPIGIQYNKRDLSEIFALEELEAKLNGTKQPSFEAIATEGVGVFRTYSWITQALWRSRF